MVFDHSVLHSRQEKVAAFGHKMIEVARYYKVNLIPFLRHLSHGLFTDHLKLPLSDGICCRSTSNTSQVKELVPSIEKNKNDEIPLLDQKVQYQILSRKVIADIAETFLMHRPTISKTYKTSSKTK